MVTNEELSKIALKRDIEDFIAGVIKRDYGVTIDEVHGMFDSRTRYKRFLEKVDKLCTPERMEQQDKRRGIRAEHFSKWRSILKHKLTARFGELGRYEVDHIDQASEEEAGRWLDRVPVGISPVDVMELF